MSKNQEKQNNILMIIILYNMNLLANYYYFLKIPTQCFAYNQIQYKKLKILSTGSHLIFAWYLLQVRTLFVSGLPMDAKPRELYLLFRGYKVSPYYFVFFLKFHAWYNVPNMFIAEICSSS